MSSFSFRLTTDVVSELASFTAPAAGAVVAFEGRVRDHNDGKTVLRLDYSAYDRLAQREGERILAEAMERFGLLRADCVHRVGSLAIGDCAVRVSVAAPHRREAFAGCAYIMDQVKSRVPIWKRELYADGDSQWVGCDHPLAAGETAT